MNPWLINLVKDVNERMMSDQEAERVIAYFDSLPQRVRLGEELERMESELVARTLKEMTADYPERGYTRGIVQDLVESLRHLFVASFVDEPSVLTVRWTDHLESLIADGSLERDWVGPVYRSIDKQIRKQLRGTLLDLYDPLMEQLMSPFVTVEAEAVA
jgi:hypothetical protein